MNTKHDYDLGLRHKAGMTANEFIRRYCEVFRPFGYATQDNSLNEFEKLITHVLNMYQYHQSLAARLGMPADPRDALDEIEAAGAELLAARSRLEVAIASARGMMTGEER